MSFDKIKMLTNNILNCNSCFSIYDYDGLTLQELLCKFFTSINEGNTVINNYTEMVDNLLNWIKNEGLNEEVIKELEKYIEDGTISNLINSEIFGNINNDIDLLKVNLELLSKNFSNVIYIKKEKDFDKIKSNSLVIIENEIETTGKTLNNLSNLIILSNVIRQVGDYDHSLNENKPVTDNPLLRFYKCNNVIFYNHTLISKNECIDIQECSNFEVIKGFCTNNKINSKANGICIRDSRNVFLDNVIVKGVNDLPKVVNNVNKYQQGNGIGVYVCDLVKIKNCICEENGQNGIYTFASKNVTIKDNISLKNGMSGIQLAFSSDNEQNQNYNVKGNIIGFNFADGIDINNTNDVMLDINLILRDNIHFNNGFDYRNGDFTQDGSGFGTFVNVKNVTIENNKLNGCNRVAYYLQKCEDFKISGNRGIKKPNTNGEYIYLSNAKNIIFSDESHINFSNDLLAIDTTYGNIEKVKINNSYLKAVNGRTHYNKGNGIIDLNITNTTLESVNKTDNIVSEVNYDNVEFVNYEKNINEPFIIMADGLMLNNCKFKSKHSNLCYIPNSCKFTNCDFIGLNETGNNVILLTDKNLFIGCKFIGKQKGIRVDANDKSNTFIGCYFKGNSRGLEVANGTVILMSCIGASNENSIRLENNSQANVINWINESGIEGFGSNKKEVEFK